MALRHIPAGAERASSPAPTKLQQRIQSQAQNLVGHLAQNCLLNEAFPNVDVVLRGGKQAGQSRLNCAAPAAASTGTQSSAIFTCKSLEPSWAPGDLPPGIICLYIHCVDNARDQLEKRRAPPDVRRYTGVSIRETLRYQEGGDGAVDDLGQLALSANQRLQQRSDA